MQPHRPKQSKNPWSISLLMALCASSMGGCTCTRDPSHEAQSPAPSLKKAAETSPHPGSDPSKPSDIHDFAPNQQKPPNDAVHGNVKSESAPMDTNHTFAGGLTWTAPPVFKRRPPMNEMRAAEYTLEKKGAEPAVLSVYFFGPNGGGSLEDNFERWTAQFAPEGRTVKRFEQPAKTKISVIDIRGTFLGMAMPGEPTATPKNTHRMMAAVASGPTGPVFFKLTGPDAVVKENEKAFLTLLESIHKI